MTHVTADFSDETHLNPTSIFVPLQGDPKTFRIETSNIMLSASGILRGCAIAETIYEAHDDSPLCINYHGEELPIVRIIQTDHGVVLCTSEQEHD